MDFRDDPETLEYFRNAGCKIVNQRVRFEPGFCRHIILENAPRISSSMHETLKNQS
jgi:trimethylamine--corrinoid protein Co-methyltransferase